MNYQELSGLAHYHEWAAKMKAPIDEKNKKILEERQRYLDQRTGIGVGDFVLDGEKTLRVAHDWGDVVQLTTGEFGASFYLGDGYVDFSGGLEPGIDKTRFQPTNERREGSVWFFSENWMRAHNGFNTNASFRVWKLENDHQHKWVTTSVEGGWLDNCECGASRFVEIEPDGFTTHEYEG